MILVILFIGKAPGRRFVLQNYSLKKNNKKIADVQVTHCELVGYIRYF